VKKPEVTSHNGNVKIGFIFYGLLLCVDPNYLFHNISFIKITTGVCYPDSMAMQLLWC